MRLCGITGIRQLRAAINADCAVDALIMANTTGYYYFPVEDEQGWEEMQHEAGQSKGRNSHHL